MGGIERGERNLTIQTIATVANGLGISLSELFADIVKRRKQGRNYAEAAEECQGLKFWSDTIRNSSIVRAGGGFQSTIPQDPEAASLVPSNMLRFSLVCRADHGRRSSDCRAKFSSSPTSPRSSSRADETPGKTAEESGGLCYIVRWSSQEQAPQFQRRPKRSCRRKNASTVGCEKEGSGEVATEGTKQTQEDGQSSVIGSTIMDIMKMLSDLRSERETIGEAIMALQRLADGSGKRRGRPPKWMSSTKAEKPPQGPKTNDNEACRQPGKGEHEWRQGQETQVGSGIL